MIFQAEGVKNMPWTNFGLNTFFGQEISTLSECNAPDLADYLREADYWIDHFALSTMLIVPVAREYKPYIFTIIRRVQMALIGYQNGRTALILFLGENQKKPSLYFQSLGYFEIAVTFLYQAYEFLRKLGKALENEEKNLFNKGDNSPLEKLNRIYSISKHLEASTIPEGNLHPIWISNEGICASEVTMSFTELATLLKEYVAIANGFSRLQAVNEHTNTNEVSDGNS